jgi:SAM-dependent methyltransferase
VQNLPKKLNVGCGRDILPGWINLDYAALRGVDVVYDLERCTEIPMPFEDDSIDEFLLSHVIEHIRNSMPLMQELHRAAKPGALARIRLPHGASDDAWEDPTHVRSYFQQSFGYFSQPYYWRADYGYRGDWQPERLYLAVSKDVYAGASVETLSNDVTIKRNVVREMVADMRAIKPIREALKELQVAPRIEFVLA